MSARPKVSVVLLTYNHEAFIEQALRSVLDQQTDFPFEIIITEDRSTDGTGQIIHTAAAEHPEQIRLIRSDVNLNTNVVTARAIDIARGDYIAFLDGDDYWTAPDKLQVQAQLLDRHPEVAMTFTDAVIVDAHGAVTAESYYDSHPCPDRGEYDDIASYCYVAGPTSLIRRSALVPVPHWYERVEVGDWPLYLRAAEHGSIAYLPKVMAAYRRHSSGYWTALPRDTQSYGVIRFLKEMAKHVPGRRESYRKALLRERSRMFKNHLRGRHFVKAAKSLVMLSAQRGGGRVAVRLTRDWLGDMLPPRRGTTD